MRSGLRLLLVAVAVSYVGLAAEPDSADKPSKPRHAANRLAKETSPYLLLHAHNPVDWYPWGEEALARAKREKKPIFLSIGYSSCYWCHVMERESFMDDEVAAALNKHFVCVKVDREERPDLDEIYMRALEVYFQLTGSTQRGGWPLSMFLTPDARPLTGGTYFPPRDRDDGRVGFLSVVSRVQEAWSKDPDKWQLAGNQMAEIVRESMRQRPSLGLVKLDQELINDAQAALAEQYDREHGGFGFDPERPQRPKFPEPPNLVFLLDRTRHAKDDEARKMLVATLDKMAQGGIRDHVGGGFHRYSTDRYWRVPHFEKMLYDNGQLTSVYANAYELTGRAEFRQVVDEIIAFVLRELTDKDGGFYAALDAETEGEEGKFYVWKAAEIEKALGPEDYSLAADVYGLRGEPNFEGHYIPLLASDVAAVARERKLDEAALATRLAAIHEKLLAKRNERPRPLTDTKILTSSNGLMIRGLADAGRILKNEQYTQAAARSADFVLAKLRSPEGRLGRSYAGGQAKWHAFLDDYAFFIGGLVALHQATGDDRWLRTADELMLRQIELFWDDRVGGFFFTAADHEVLIARSKVPTDSAVPSGNSVSAANLLYLSAALKKPDYRDRAEKTLSAAAPLMKQSPLAAPQMAAALAEFLRSK